MLRHIDVSASSLKTKGGVFGGMVVHMNVGGDINKYTKGIRKISDIF